MSRTATPYADGGKWTAPEGYGIATYQHIAGYYTMRLRSNAVNVGVRIWHGPPCDPETGDEMDRHHRWQAEVNGRYVDIERVWPFCASEPVAQAEYEYLTAASLWARQNAPTSPQANPHKPVDFLTAPLKL